MPERDENEASDITQDDLERLITSKGWRWLCDIGEQRINNYLQEVLQPLTPDTIYEREYTKGRMDGIEKLISVPAAHLKELREYAQVASNAESTVESDAGSGDGRSDSERERDGDEWGDTGSFHGRPPPSW